jgi:hypothetical protein
MTNVVNPNTTLRSSWLARTGQVWKIWILVLLAVIGSGLLVADWFPGGLLATILRAFVSQRLDWGLCILVYGVVILVPWMLLAIKCPNCRRRPVLHLVRSHDFRKWFPTLLSMETCPLCRDDGLARSNRRQ